ncbi:ATP-dependent DNA ligase [Tsuneonella deserti]|nr:ATP-dependent DNA ligase [Tsuneonella deserti]
MNTVRSMDGLEIPLSTPPMEARLVDHLPQGDDLQYEPKWDGFRCLVFRDHADVALMSKSGKPLHRYFPELAAALGSVRQKQFVVDGEIVLPINGVLSFAALQSRLHPAASRIERLSRETPAQLMLFDCLQLGSQVLIDEPLANRRAALEKFAAGLPESIMLSPVTLKADVARDWLARSGGALDGVIAKRRDQAYQPGERAMFKHKVERTADCVIGGFRYDAKGTKIASLLLGLHDGEGLLHHVGFTSSFNEDQRAELRALLEPLKGASAFTGSAPGGASRWSKNGRSSEWMAVEPKLVAEVRYDQVTGGRFRHGTTFLRWRPDKSPTQCTLDQLSAELGPAELETVLSGVPG